MKSTSDSLKTADFDLKLFNSIFCEETVISSKTMPFLRFRSTDVDLFSRNLFDLGSISEFSDFARLNFFRRRARLDGFSSVNLDTSLLEETKNRFIDSTGRVMISTGDTGLLTQQVG